MSGEETVKLGEACEILNGFAFKSSRYVEEGIRIIRIANVQKGCIEDASPCFYPYDSEGQISQFILHEGDLLMSLTGNVGRVGLLEKDMLPAALNQRVACLRLRNSAPLDKSYLFHLLNSDDFEQKCIDASNGVAQKNLSSRWLSSFEVPIVPIYEQKHRSAVLDCITTCLSKLREEIVVLDNLVKSRFIEMFGDPNIVAINHGIEDAFDIRDDLRKPLNDAERAKMREGKEIYPYYGANGQVDSINDYRMDCTALCLAEDCGSYGPGEPTSYIVHGKCWVNNHAHVLLPKECCNIEFANVFFKHLDISQFIAGTTRSKLTQAQMKKLPMMLPSIHEQNAFAYFVVQVDKSKAAVQKAIEKLELLKASLMQEYFG